MAEMAVFKVAGYLVKYREGADGLQICHLFPTKTTFYN